ncbi:family 43 glycosylhydrolase [Paenibacillus doosanensis]|uniref:LamG-like jellyroll fold domain-containing protein n=1 Tax=Paenibacillus doosanensis TaxID=1229154 RepID=UPI00217F33B7|nr:LamG-like jellyroll fold domain-containing protein [Paenibacillus doosanensis]MCS7461350.1 family 43 glycosylhydrolase [Paenibacillus doosanensis]
MSQFNQPETAGGAPAYVMGYFRSGPNQMHKEEKLHYAYSRDGLHWYELNENRPVFTTSVGEGVLRDPFIAKGADGCWHMVFTIRPRGIHIGYSRSTDLIVWEDERKLPVMQGIDDAKNSWAPEFTYDHGRDQYLLYWASSCGPDLGNSKHYAVWTPDWLTLTEPSLFFDPGYQTIDASLAEHEGKYYMAVKDESVVYDRSVKHPCHNVLAVADRLEGPYTVVPGVRTPDHTEGPEFLKLEGTNRWLLFYDYWSYGKFGMMETTDFREWRELDQDEFRIPYRARHNTVFPVNESELARLLDTYALLAQYGTPTYAPVRLAAEEADGFLHNAFSLRTMTMQFCPNRLAGTQVLFDEGDGKNGWALRLRDGMLEAAVASEGERIILQTPVQAHAGDSWRHAALSFAEGAVSLYLDGKLAGSVQAGFGIVGPHTGAGGYGGRFGGDAFGDACGADAFDGVIRQVKLYSVPLQEADIAMMIRGR